MQKKTWLHSSITFFMPPKSGLSKFKPIIQTRTRNKTSHPGQVINDAKQKRRSHEEMEKIRADETRMRQEKEVEQAENIQKAADVEDRMRREDINRRSSNRQATGQAPFRPPSATISADVEDRMPVHREDINRRSLNRQTTGQAPFRPPSTTIDEWGAENKGLSDFNQSSGNESTDDACRSRAPKT
jgi:hypothetical protein